jgi:putative MATE family efflux protein
MAQAAARNDFSQGSVTRAILQMAVPITAAQLVNILYNVVDRMYIGRIPDAGAMALTGLGLCMPLISIVLAFSRLCGMGGAPLCSIERGRGDLEKAEQIMGNAFFLLLVSGVALTVLGLAFLRPILFAFGASAETYPYAAGYGRIYLLGNVFVLISAGMNSFINAQGFARTGMLTVVLGAVVNIVLDPIFIFVLGLGVQGAAMATVIAQGCSAIWVLGFLLGKKAILKLRLRHLRPQAALIRKITGLGAAGFVMAITNSIVQVIANRTLQAFGGDLYVGVMTVVNSIREVITMPLQGLTSGSEPVIGFNYGAGCYSRVRKAIRVSCGVCIIYNAAVWGFLLAFPTVLIRVFTNDSAILEAGRQALRIYYGAYFLMALQMAGQSAFVALNHAKQAVFFSMFRKVIIVVPLMLALPHVGNLGVLGVFWSEPISDLIGGLACFTTMYLTVYRPLKTMPEKSAS